MKWAIFQILINRIGVDILYLVKQFYSIAQVKPDILALKSQWVVQHTMKVNLQVFRINFEMKEPFL